MQKGTAKVTKPQGMDSKRLISFFSMIAFPFFLITERYPKCIVWIGTKRMFREN